MDLGDAQDLVYNTVVPWVAQQAIIVPPNIVDTSRTFSALPPNGYEIDWGDFQNLCTLIINAGATAGVKLALAFAWKQNQFNNSTIDDFNGQTAALLAAAPALATS